MNTIKKIGVLMMCAISAMSMKAQTTTDEMQLLTVNENVTTVITASEPVRLVDISTDKVAGDQPINNTIRLKPKEGVEVNKDGDILAIVTIVTERYRTQYALIYTSRLTEDMTRYARQIWNSPAKFRNVGTKMHRMYMRLNNIYAVGEYFFLDFSVENKTNIQFDIDQLRVKLSDKKTSKATVVQTIELTPELILEPTRGFKYGYRNVIVLKKMTFPNDKVLTIELSEKQISGRTIYLNIEYNDVLTADSFNHAILYEE